MKCNKTQDKWCKNKHGASKIIDTFETYQGGADFSMGGGGFPAVPPIPKFKLDKI
jgi:hypothetical protein